MIIAHITHLHPPVHCVGTTSAHRAAFREELPSSIHLASGRLPNSGIVCLSPFSIICVHELQEFELWIIFSAQNVSLLDSQWGTRIYSNNYLLSESESMKRVQKSRNRFPRERERERVALLETAEDFWRTPGNNKSLRYTKGWNITRPNKRQFETLSNFRQKESSKEAHLRFCVHKFGSFTNVISPSFTLLGFSVIALDAFQVELFVRT